MKMTEKTIAAGHKIYCEMMDAGAFDKKDLGGHVETKPKMKRGKKKMVNHNPRWKQIQKESPFKPITGRDWQPR